MGGRITPLISGDVENNQSPFTAGKWLQGEFFAAIPPPKNVCWILTISILYNIMAID